MQSLIQGYGKRWAGSLIAAWCVAGAMAHAQEEIIIDNNASSGVVITGTWYDSTSGSGYYGSNFMHDKNTLKGQCSATYTPNLQGGTYQVYIRYPGGSASGKWAANVPVDVIHKNGTDALSLDIRTGGGQWVLLGSYEFDAGTGGSVRISNTGTGKQVNVDAVRFVKSSGPSDAQILADGLASWRKPDGDGISCAECHTPAGYDVAIFNFNQADLRRATAPHLNDTDADKIFAMIELHRRNYPPAGGLKNVETFRPFQPGGIVLGGAGSSNRVRDNAFADYLAVNYKMAQANVIDTLSEANEALNELVAVDLTQLPVGLEFNKWSESVSRSGVNEGGRVAEWIPGIGQQPRAENRAQWFALVDAYIANPSDANFWAMFHKMDDYLIPDPVNNAPVVEVTYTRQAFAIFAANNAFAHNELNKARGVAELQFTDGVKPFPDQAGQGSVMSFMWEVGDMARIFAPGAVFNQMPLRHQQSLFNEDGAWAFRARLNDMRIPWMWIGFMHDPVMWHSGGTTATLMLEYMLAEGWPRDLRMHNAFAAIMLPTKRGLLPNSWNPGRWSDMGTVQNVNLRLGTQFLGYQRYAKEEWDTNTTAYTAYRRWIANGYRALALRQTADIVAYGRHWNDDHLLNNEAEAVRAAINWADPANKTKNDQIIDALKAAVAQYPK
jgi:hypothetical protein